MHTRRTRPVGGSRHEPDHRHRSRLKPAHAEGCRVSPRARVLALESVVASRGARCEHCLGAIYEICVGQEWFPAELVGAHFEPHDCVPRAWYPVPIVAKVY
jgi:hypothetical protein